MYGIVILGALFLEVYDIPKGYLWGAACKKEGKLCGACRRQNVWKGILFRSPSKTISSQYEGRFVCACVLSEGRSECDKCVWEGGEGLCGWYVRSH